MFRVGAVSAWIWLFAACSTTALRTAPAPKPAPHVVAAQAPAMDPQEAQLLAAASGKNSGSAELELAQFYLDHGRYSEALRRAAQAAEHGADAELAACIRAQVARNGGDLELALTELRSFAQQPGRRWARLQIAEVLLELGKSAEARGYLLEIIGDYNTDKIAAQDGQALAQVGRAAYLLRSPHDANDAFNASERAAKPSAVTLLWRARLFLDNYDAAHAEQTLLEVLAETPKHAEALALLAEVRLVQAYDFTEATRLAKRALEINPRHNPALATLVDIALRENSLAEAEALIRRGLANNPRDLRLLSQRAAKTFLSGKPADFLREKAEVLNKNPEYSRFYEVIATYGEWEHRYDALIPVLEEGKTRDDKNPHLHAELGINLLRNAQEERGLRELNLSFVSDPFNVRVYNTLNLFDRVIPREYVSVARGPFVFRFPASKREFLERYVPDLLDKAWAEFRTRYDFTPQAPVHIELYDTEAHFSVRTSGLPHSPLFGVCFGKSLAVLTPGEKTFNLGMTLWHELSHVFHIQLSESKVPRWFTEGLAEYDTMRARPEWQRELDQDLYLWLKAGRLPAINRMGDAFTRAERMADISTAYYASTKIVEFIGATYGTDKFGQMLRHWAASETTEQVLQNVLKTDAAALTQAFKRETLVRLKAYNDQFFPDFIEPAPSTQLCPDAETLWKNASEHLAEKSVDGALQLLNHAPATCQNLPNLVYLRAEIMRRRGDWKAATRALGELDAQGKRGYFIELLRGQIAQAQGHVAQARAAFEKAHAADSQQLAPLYHLLSLAGDRKSAAGPIPLLTAIAERDEHNPDIYEQLLSALLEKQPGVSALNVGESGIFSGIFSPTMHELFAEALARSGNLQRSRFELESALLRADTPEVRARLRQKLARASLAGPKTQSQVTH